MGHYDSYYEADAFNSRNPDHKSIRELGKHEGIFEALEALSTFKIVLEGDGVTYAQIKNKYVDISMALSNENPSSKELHELFGKLAKALS